MTGPLSGVRVLDMTRILAGPFTTMLLGDLGAEIIKIEKPVSGDDTRSWAPPFCENESTYFLSINRNKKSIAVNIKNPKGTEIVRKVLRKRLNRLQSFSQLTNSSCRFRLSKI